MLRGTVKWFNNKKGYGFINPDGEEKDVFVHITALEKSGLRSLSEGSRVNFDIYDDRGRKAGNFHMVCKTRRRCTADAGDSDGGDCGKV